MALPAQAATAPLAITALALAKCVASSAAFQALVGAATAVDALDRIYFQEAPDDKDPDAPEGEETLLYPRPRAIIYIDKCDRMHDGPGEWHGDTTLRLAFEVKVPDSYLGNKREEQFWVLNTIGQIAAEMEVLRDAETGLGGFYAFETLTLFDGPGPCDRVNELEYFWGAQYLVTGRNS